MTLNTQPAWPKKEFFRLLLLVAAFLLLNEYFLFFFYQGFAPGAHFQAPVLAFAGLPYHSFSICLGALLNPFFLGAIVFIYFCVYRWRIVFDFSAEHSWFIRLPVFVAAALLTWEMVTYDTNYYLGSAFYFDRFLLVALTFALMRYPVLVPLYVCFLLVYRSQFNYPIGGFMLIDKKILIDFLLLFCAWNMLKKWVSLTTQSYLLVVFCMIASSYFFCGLAKVFISPHGYEWMAHNDLNLFFANARSRGWMDHLSPDSLKNISHFFDSWGTCLEWCIFFTETSMFFLLWKRRVAAVLLVACLAMHIGIFLPGSMLFWKWMAVDLLLLCFVLSGSPAVKNLFTPRYFKYSALLIALSFIWLRSSLIGWHDTPLNQFFTFEAVDEKGNTQVLSRNDFEPYHQLFQIDRFMYLVDSKRLNVSGFGYTFSHKLAHQIKKAGARNIDLLEKKKGRNAFDARKRIVFVHFIQEFFRNRNHQNGSHPWLYYLHAPYHLYSSARGYSHPVKQVTQVRVYFEQTWCEGDQLITLAKKPCEIINIPR